MNGEKKRMTVVSEGSGGNLDIPASLAVVQSRPVLPKLPDVEEAESLAEQVVRVREGAEQISAWVGNFLALRERLDQMERIERELTQGKIELDPEEAEQTLRKYLWETSTQAFRRAAWMAVLSHELRSDGLDTREEARARLQSLVQEKLLAAKPDGKGHFTTYSIAYEVPAESCFNETEVRQVALLAEQLVQCVGKRERAAWRKELPKLQAQATITYEQFEKGEPGTICLQVPPEPIIDPRSKEVTSWRSGGHLLVSFDGEDIHPVKAIGKIAQAIAQAVDLGVFLRYTSLRWEKPPYIERLPDEQRKKVQLLWHLLQRAIRFQEEKKEIAQAKEVMAEKASLTPQEFLVEGKPGDCLVSFNGTWREPTTGDTTYHLFFLARRTNDGKILVVECPKHIKELLAPCLGKEFDEGDKLEGVGLPLRAILRACYGQQDQEDPAEETVEVAV